ncbi:MAG: MoaD/ThiS family protein [Chloroflexi bacterium]|nr:MoaD/ThiS family protein [Chloroflexota bacterium]
MANIVVDVWLYGALAKYGGEAAESAHANLKVSLPEGSTMADLLKHLGLPTEERGITFISGNLSAMPGLQPDLGHVLKDGDRVGIFDPRSMWPFQYRHGAAMIPEMARAINEAEDLGLHHSYRDTEA